MDSIIPQAKIYYRLALVMFGLASILGIATLLEEMSSAEDGDQLNAAHVLITLVSLGLVCLTLALYTKCEQRKN